MSELSDKSPIKTKKQKINPEAYKRNIIKKLNLQGKEYIGQGGKLQRAKATQEPWKTVPGITRTK